MYRSFFLQAIFFILLARKKITLFFMLFSIAVMLYVAIFSQVEGPSGIMLQLTACIRGANIVSSSPWCRLANKINKSYRSFIESDRKTVSLKEKNNIPLILRKLKQFFFLAPSIISSLLVCFVCILQNQKFPSAQHHQAILTDSCDVSAEWAVCWSYIRVSLYYRLLLLLLLLLWCHPSWAELHIISLKKHNSAWRPGGSWPPCGW